MQAAGGAGACRRCHPPGVRAGGVTEVAGWRRRAACRELPCLSGWQRRCAGGGLHCVCCIGLQTLLAIYHSVHQLPTLWRHKSVRSAITVQQRAPPLRCPTSGCPSNTHRLACSHKYTCCPTPPASAWGSATRFAKSSYTSCGCQHMRACIPEGTAAVRAAAPSSARALRLSHSPRATQRSAQVVEAGHGHAARHQVHLRAGEGGMAASVPQAIQQSAVAWYTCACKPHPARRCQAGIPRTPASLTAACAGHVHGRLVSCPPGTGP